MGLLFIVGSFVLMLVGAFPLAAGFSAGSSVLVMLGLVTFGVTAWLFVRCTRVAVVITPDALTVRNLLSTHHLSWAQVADIRPRLARGSALTRGPHAVLTVGVADPALTRIEILATRTVLDGSGARLFPLLAVLDVHAVSDGFTVDHRLPDGTPLPGSPR